jgi:hypothetical protein
MYWALRKWLLEFAALGTRDRVLREFGDRRPRRQGTRTAPRRVWIETPANPTWDITDIAAASTLAREVGAIVAVDSTSATPMLTQPIALGAHIVMHSATKYLNGHSDVIAASATAHDDALWQRIRYARSGRRRLGPLEAGSCCAHAYAGAAPGVVRNARTRIACSDIRSSRTSYPGLESIPARVAAKQMHGGFGGMMSLRVAGGGDAAKALPRAFASSSRRRRWGRSKASPSIAQRSRARNVVSGRPRACGCRARRRLDRGYRRGARLNVLMFDRRAPGCISSALRAVCRLHGRLLRRAF